MNILLCLICLSLLIYFFDEQIKKYSTLFYILSILLSCIGIFIPRNTGFIPIDYFFGSLLKRGVIAGALFILVMYAIIFPFNKNLRSKLMKLRGELAIIASLLTLVHNVVFGKKYFVLLFTGIEKLKVYEIIAAIISLIMIILLIPLTITSFKLIRKKMDAKRWKNLQRYSYLFYALLYVHIALLFSKGILLAKINYIIDFIIYTLIFAIYLVLRLKYYIEKNKNISNKDLAKKLTIILVSTIAFIAIIISTLPLFSKNKASVDNSNTNVELSLKGENSANLSDGIYEGKASGYNGNLYLEVKILEGKISEINVTKHVEDEDYFYDAYDGVVPKILKQQNTNVDIVSGSTTTSEAIIKAVNNALSSK